MNELLNQELVSIIKASKEGIIKGIDVLQQQAPELVNQIIKFTLIKSFMYIVISLILSIFFGYKLSKNYNFNMTGFVFYLIGFIIMLICFFANIEGFMKVYISPKLFILEYVHNQLSTNRW